LAEDNYSLTKLCDGAQTATFGVLFMAAHSNGQTIIFLPCGFFFLFFLFFLFLFLLFFFFFFLA